jgi:phosphoribosylglycinamide formyltransferase-1
MTFCRFSIKGKEWDPFWEEFKKEREAQGLEAIKNTQGEAQPIFAAIRREGVNRELPLIVETMRSLAMREIYIRDGKLFDQNGKELKGPYDLSENVEESINN